MNDLISRQSAIDAVNSWRGRFSEEYNEAIDDCENSIIKLPSIQSEPSIQLSWIEEYIEQLHNARGIYSELRVNIINRMIDEWRKGEQNE